jgi:hypothetical protein
MLTSITRHAICAALILQCACRALPPEAGSRLQLLSSQPLQLAAGCETSSSVVVDFVIDASGSTGDISVPAAPPCLQQALRTWVASFKYAPLPTSTPSSVEWLLVTAPRS